MSKIIAEFPTEEDLIKQIMHISATVWKHELTGQDISNWLSNFKGQVFSKEEEQRVALWLLTHFVYYNEDEVRHLCGVLYRDFIHHLLEENQVKPANVNDFISELVSNYSFYHVGQTAESGAYLLYYFRQQNDLALINFPKMVDISAVVSSKIIFIDDVTLTGDETSQAYLFFKDLKVENERKILLTLIASEEAISKLQTIGVTVISTIVLQDRNKCFHQASEIFHHHADHLETCKSMVQHYGEMLKPNAALGYKDGQYTFGFFITPRTTLFQFFGQLKIGFLLLKGMIKS